MVRQWAEAWLGLVNDRARVRVLAAEVSELRRRLEAVEGAARKPRPPSSEGVDQQPLYRPAPDAWVTSKQPRSTLPSYRASMKLWEAAARGYLARLGSRGAGG